MAPRNTADEQYLQNNNGGGRRGSIFCIDTKGNFTNLYSFDQNGFDGFSPIGAMVQGTNGAFYGITSSGGANGDGTIFKFTPGAATGFVVWFNEDLGKQQSGQNGNGGYYGYNYAALFRGIGRGRGRHVYGTAPQGGVKAATAPCSVSFSSNTPRSRSLAGITSVVGTAR